METSTGMVVATGTSVDHSRSFYMLVDRLVMERAHPYFIFN
jgi:hypothetical protein